MFKWLYFEIKQMLKNRKNIMVFIFLLMLHVLTLSYYSNDSDILTNKMDDLAGGELWYEQFYGISFGLQDSISIEDQKINEEILQTITDNDIDEYNKLTLIKELIAVNRIERYLLNLQVSDNEGLNEKIASYYDNQKVHLSLKEKIYEEFGYVDNSESVDSDLSIYNSRVNHLQYKYDVYKKGFMHYEEPSKSSLTITLTLFRQYVVFFVVLVPIIIGYDVFSKDKKDGSIRSIMALSQSRSKYLLVKIVSALFVSLMVIILPLILALMINNISIINDLKYPSYVYTDGLTSLKAINPIMDYEGVAYRLDEYSFHSRAVFNLNEFGFVIGVQDGVRLLSLGHMLGFSFIIVVFMVLFVLSVQLSIAINSNRNIAIVIIVSLLAILFVLSLNKQLVTIKNTNYGSTLQHRPSLLAQLNPMAYLNAVDVTEGTVPFTFLGALLTLGGYSIICSSIAVFFLNKKDITF